MENEWAGMAIRAKDFHNLAQNAHPRIIMVCSRSFDPETALAPRLR
jgi:hypothetical protein